MCTFACTEYEEKKNNDLGAMTTAKNKIFIGLMLENCYLVGGWTFGEE